MSNSNTETLINCGVLGRGSYSTVYLATPQQLKSSNLRSASQFVAVKSALVQDYESLYMESQILYDLRGCPDIVQCFGDDFSKDENNRLVYNILLEFSSEGDLHRHIQRYGPVTEMLVQWYTYKLLKGLSHIHEQGYVHCDFKPSNILVFPSPITTLNYLKISDFGLAKKQGDYNPKVKTGCCFRCTPLYSSPESLYGEHEAPMDIWALGCIIVEMLTAKPMWSDSTYTNLDELAYNIVTKDVPDMPVGMSQKGKDFLRRCLDKDPKSRWTARMLLNHPYITEFDFAEIDEDRNMLARESPVGLGWVSSLDLLVFSSLKV